MTDNSSTRLDDDLARRLLDQARRRGAHLVALHAWRLPTAYEGLGYGERAVEDWMASAGEEMARTLTPFRETYPDVQIEVDLRYEFSGPALLRATDDADLIVVGRRGHGAPWGVYLGSLARMLIREGKCPVEICPQRRRGDSKVEERLLGTADELCPEM